MSVSPATGVNAVVSAITGAIRQAAQATATSFGYLLATAKVESNFNPQATASTSSASGLFQFIEQTWLSVMKEAGPRLGYGQYADAIAKTPSGHLQVADPAMRAKILNLRHDPTANAVMAGAFTEKNASLLAARLGRQPSEGELYIAHFLGASGAAKLITAGKSQASAADLFPNAARANHSIFYDKQGRARSAGEVYATLTHRYDVARAGAVVPAGMAVAMARGAPVPRQVAAVVPTNADVAAVRPAPARQQVAARVPDTAGIAQAFAASAPAPARVDDTEPVFQALFHTGERREAVAPRVNQLWGARVASAAARTAALPADAVAPAPARGGPLDLFQDMPPDVRGLFGNKG